MKPLVIYHADCADGQGAAFAAWLKLGGDAEYVPMQYGRIPEVQDLRDLVDERDVYVLDFSLPRVGMDELFSSANRVVWLDHHKTAFEMWYGEYEKGMRVHENVGNPDVHELILDDNKSGALLAWEWFHGRAEIPMLIRHIDDYDRWQFKLEGTKELHAALSSYAPWSFEQWNRLYSGLAKWDDKERVAPLIEEGAHILRAQDAHVKSIFRGAGRCEIPVSKPTGGWEEFKTTWFRGLAVNSPVFKDDIGHALANASGTYGLIWYTTDGVTAKCSLRSNGDYDVSAIAKAFGGGGHRNAAGFEIDMQTLLSWLY